MTFMTIEQLAQTVAKDPVLVQELIEAAFETSGFFQDPTAKKEEMIGTQGVVQDVVDKVEKIWMTKHA